MTGACGAVKPNRKFMVKFPPRLQKGDDVHKQANYILAVKWKNKQDVHLLTSVHELRLHRSENTDHSTNTFIHKPEGVIVGNSDSMMSSVECSRKTMHCPQRPYSVPGQHWREAYNPWLHKGGKKTAYEAVFWASSYSRTTMSISWWRAYMSYRSSFSQGYPTYSCQEKCPKGLSHLPHHHTLDKATQRYAVHVYALQHSSLSGPCFEQYHSLKIY